MNHFPKPIILASALLLASPALSGARAEIVTFAQFNQQMVADQDFTYTNRSTSASFEALSQGIPIFLTITDGFAPNLARVQSAHLFLATSTSETVMPPVAPDLFTRQHFTGSGNLLQVVLDTPVDGKSNFLTAMFSNGLFSGRVNATEASLKTSDTDSGNPSQVTFTSDFIDFSTAVEHGLSLSFSSVSTIGGGFLQVAGNNFFESFTTSGTGTFDTEFPAAPVAEPASLILAGLGALGTVGFLWRRNARRGHLTEEAC